jgi:cytochrome c553
MSRQANNYLGFFTLAVGGFALLAAPPPTAQVTVKNQPKLEAIAETRLLMEGLAHANFRGIERLLQEKPADGKAWTFARGQALLIAETGNLLMLRPPKSKGQAMWFDRAVELRSSAQQLAKTVATQDLEKSRAGLLNLATSCNRCHQAFGVKVEISPFAQKLDLPLPLP